LIDARIRIVKIDEMTEAEIDQNLTDSFPASDPPSWTLGSDHKEELPDPEKKNPE
jgi:hypothetical protein